MCVNAASISTQAFNNPQVKFSDACHRGDSSTSTDTYCNSDWVTGTFLPPAKDGPILPNEIVTSTDIETMNRSIKKKSKEAVLEDGTIVLSKFSNDKEKKRQSEDGAESSKKKTPKNK